MIRDHGSERRYYHDLVGMNARLDEIQAVVLRAKASSPVGLERAAPCTCRPCTTTPARFSSSHTGRAAGNTHIYHLYVVRVPQRDELQALLKVHGIFTGIHYPVPNHLQPAMKSLGYKQGDLPVTEQVVNEIISIPMYPELIDNEIEIVANVIKDFLLRKVKMTWLMKI